VVVNLDNLVGKSARNAVRATGAHLPPDSPDLNSSEQVFAKLKHLMRAAQTWR
jgi:transposase